MRRLKEKIADLQKEPDHVKFRAVGFATVISGAVLVLVWLVILLPLQLRLNRGNDGSATPEEELLKQVRQSPTPALEPESQVGGSQDINRFTPRPSPLNPTFTPTPTLPASQLPVPTTLPGEGPTVTPGELTP